MKQILQLLLLLCVSVVAPAQSLDSAFEVRNFQLEKDVYALDYGTRGLLLVFEYKYANTQERLTSVVPKVVLKKNGMEVYSNDKTLLLLKNNDEWTTAQLFLPYRDINLLSGHQKEVHLSLKLAKLLDYKTEFALDQPLRYAVEIMLKGGNVKEKLEKYDQGPNPQEWLPDPYYTFTTNGGTEPVYKSKVLPNSYKLKKQKIQFYILEGEQLDWNFYDRDGGKDLKLGTLAGMNPAGEHADEVYGEMFGNIRYLKFHYAQRAQSHQAITIYSNPNYVHNGKKGVAITVEYDLAKAYVDKKAKTVLNFYTKNGIKIDVPILKSLGETPEAGAWVDLTVKDKYVYFIPFYVWNENCHDVEFYFELGNGEQVNGARHTLLTPITFDEWLIEAGMAVEENVMVKGARGIAIKLAYELVKEHKNTPLYVKFYDENGTVLPFPVYNMIGGDVLVNVQGEHITRNPRRADRMSYFIPYTSLKNQKIKVQMDLVPDVAMNMLKKETPLFTKPKKGDIQLDLLTAEGRFRVDNYGQVLEMKLRVPEFFLDKTKVQIQVKKNGKPWNAFLLDGILSKSDKGYIAQKDSGLVYVVFPHRNIVAGTTFSLLAFVVDETGKKVLSDSVQWRWKAPQDLFNRKIDLALATCKFSKRIMQDTLLDRQFPWDYIVEAGGEVLVEEPLEKRLTNRKLKDQFRQQVLVNREDNIVVKLKNKKTGQNVMLWKGDLGKWEQNDFKAELNNKYPAKMIRVLAKVDKDYKKNNDNGML